MKFPFFLAAFIASLSLRSQTFPVGTPVFEESIRRLSVGDTSQRIGSLTVRPIFANVQSLDSITNLLRQAAKKKAINKAGPIYILPFVFQNQINTHHSFGWNDGSMIPSKGYEGQISFGAFAKLGMVSIQLNPEFVFAQNASFSNTPSGWTDSIWKSYYTTVLNKVDLPDRFGKEAYAKLFPGQSSIRVNYKRLSLGISTENLWWGPGIRNALIMTNNAPGFLHLTFNTTAPVNTSIGNFEWQLVSGLLKSSGITPDSSRRYNGIPLYQSKINDDRYLNGIVICWEPKWTKGLYLGFSRVFYVYQSDVKNSLNGYLPVFATFFKSAASEEDQLKRDQILSVFMRLVLPKEKAEVYAEYGRNDHAGTTRDLLLEPEHSRAYLFGFRKIFPIKANRSFELAMEFTNLQLPATNQVREQESWYAHYQVRDGYTNKGQVIGAGIGPGANSQTFNFNWLKGTDKLGFQFERIVHNNDFYFNAFGPTRNYQRHWVDLSFGLQKSWFRKNLFYNAELAIVKSLNYYWEQDKDVHNLHLKLSVGYIFK